MKRTKRQRKGKRTVGRQQSNTLIKQMRNYFGDNPSVSIGYNPSEHIPGDIFHENIPIIQGTEVTRNRDRDTHTATVSTDGYIPDAEVGRIASVLDGNFDHILTGVITTIDNGFYEDGRTKTTYIVQERGRIYLTPGTPQYMEVSMVPPSIDSLTGVVAGSSNTLRTDDSFSVTTGQDNFVVDNHDYIIWRGTDNTLTTRVDRHAEAIENTFENSEERE